MQWYNKIQFHPNDRNLCPILNIPFVNGSDHGLWQVHFCAVIFQVLVPDRHPNMGAITGKNSWVVPTPRINLLSEIHFELRKPTKEPGDKCVGTHEGCSQAVVGGIEPVHLLAEPTERNPACLDPADEVPSYFISSSSNSGGEENGFLSSFLGGVQDTIPSQTEPGKNLALQCTKPCVYHCIWSHLQWCAIWVICVSKSSLTPK